MKHATAVTALETAFIPPEYKVRLRKNGLPDRRGKHKRKPQPLSHPWKRPFNFGKVSPDYKPR